MIGICLEKGKVDGISYTRVTSTRVTPVFQNEIHANGEFYLQVENLREVIREVESNPKDSDPAWNEYVTNIAAWADFVMGTHWRKT